MLNEDLFFEKIHFKPGCWEWTAAISVQGYGVFGQGRSVVGAHRLAFEFWKGPIPDGAVIDHLCRNRACVNPGHLEAVTHRVNILRGTGCSARNAAKTTCPKGHPLVDGNLVVRANRQSRECRTCANDSNRRTHARKVAARG